MADLVIIKSRMLFSEVCTYVKICKTVYFSYKLLITYNLYLCKALKIGSRKKNKQNPCPTLYGTQAEKPCVDSSISLLMPSGRSVLSQ